MDLVGFLLLKPVLNTMLTIAFNLAAICTFVGITYELH